MGRPVYIYALIDPRTDEVRYIGKTERPKARARDHCQANHLQLDTRKTRWIRGLLEVGLRPVLRILEETDEAHWEERERDRIRRFREQGANLLNIAPGGGGPSPEARARGARQGLRLHPESVARGMKHPMAKFTDALVLDVFQRFIAGERADDLAEELGINAGNVLDVLRSERWGHVPIAPQLRVEARRLLEAHKRGSGLPQARLTEEQVESFLLRRAGGESNKALAQEAGVDEVTMSHLLHGKNWKHVSREGITLPPNPYKRKLTPEIASVIKRELREGAAQRTLARKYGVSHPTIQGIASGKYYKDMQDSERDLKVQAVADMLEVHPATIRVWLRGGRFPHAYQFGQRGGWHIPRSDVEALKGRPTP